ncbi:MAG: hypothetical protein R3F62_31470 [Planctomycetota bacterium]
MFLIDRLHRADPSEDELQAAVEAVLMNEATPSHPLTRAGKPVALVRKQLGSDPRSQFLELDRLAADGHAVDGPLPKRVFWLVRALEASAVAVEARTERLSRLQPNRIACGRSLTTNCWAGAVVA